MKKIITKNLAISEELYERVMEYSFKNKIYKFTAATIQLLDLALKAEDKKEDK